MCEGYCKELSTLYRGAVGPFGQYTSTTQIGVTLGNFVGYFFTALSKLPHLEASLAISTGVRWGGEGVWEVTDPSQPIYTESRWDFTRLQAFRQGSPVAEWMVLLAGIASVLAHAAAVRAVVQAGGGG